MSQPVFVDLQSLADLTGMTLDKQLFEHTGRPSDVERRGMRGAYRNQASIKKAQFLIAITINDDARALTWLVSSRLRRSTIEAQAEKAWTRLLVQYRKVLPELRIWRWN